MKALVYHGPGQRGWDTVEDPTIVDPTDIVVRIDSSTICGTDLAVVVPAPVDLDAVGIESPTSATTLFDPPTPPSPTPSGDR